MNPIVESLKTEVSDWLAYHDRAYREWFQDDYDCMRTFPKDLAALDCMAFLEWRNSDGGILQVFGETFAHWREFSDYCEFGYQMIGAQPQVEAIRQMRVSFEALDAPFREIVEKSFTTDNYDLPREWLADKNTLSPQYNFQKRLFYSDEVTEKRDTWLLENSTRLRCILNLNALNRIAKSLNQLPEPTGSILEAQKLIARAKELLDVRAV